jgi:hypothetical protein
VDLIQKPTRSSRLFHPWQKLWDERRFRNIGPAELNPTWSAGSTCLSRHPAKPSKNGLVESPYVPGKPVDIQGFPPGATVRDPYVDKLFIVPAPSQEPEQ